MKIQTIKSARVDSYGFKWVHKTKTSKKKAIETIGTVNNPIYKRVSDGKTVKEFDKGLFGEWILRK